MPRSRIKRFAVAAFVGAAMAATGLGPLNPASAGPNQDCEALGGEVERGGGAPRCVEADDRNPGQTVVKTHQWHGGDFTLTQECTYAGNGNLVPGQSDPGCPESP
ncbi:MAG TPA: hypothetical protein VJ804_15185 [Acidimicrobiales bacterium]|nr:hypothetical protein [Acidimicrobiales bacterium]